MPPCSGSFRQGYFAPWYPSSVGKWSSSRYTPSTCWPQRAKAITLMARACLFCQRGKVHKHVHLQPAEIPVPHRRFTHIHVNLVSPLPPFIQQGCQKL
jgi:hypothetical protein